VENTRHKEEVPMGQDDRQPVLTGGCQCGRVRYAFYGEPVSADICHCRMCQRALGNLFGSFAGIRLGDFAWIKGEPATYQSSSIVERGFCGHCGTPLSFRYRETDKISVTIGSLDQPARARPTEQVGIESRVPWLHEALALPGKRTEDDPPPGGLAAITSYQEPTGSG
jgi:hypothetical protein